jgi:hypothetical protein
MLKARLTLALLLAVPAVAQPTPSVPLLAQAFDRCMATYAVRLTRTLANDDAIYAEAIKGCQEIDGQLRTAVRAQMPAAEAEKLFAQFDASSRPEFMALLQRIRADRAARAAQN